MKLLITILLFFLSLQSPAQNNETQGYLMPWEFAGFDSEQSQVLSKLMTASWERIADLHLDNPRSLSEHKTPAKSLNSQRIRRRYKFGNSKLASDDDIFIQPIICRIKKDAIFGIQVGSLKTGLIDTLKIQIIPLEALLQNKTDKDQLKQMFDKLTVTQWRKQKSPLKLQLNLKRASNNTTIAANLCHNTMLSQALLKRFNVQQFLGSQNTNYVRGQVGESNPLSRANRTIHIDWLEQKARLLAYAELSESVFGHEIHRGDAWPIAAPYPQNIQVPEKLMKKLLMEEASLNQETAPMVASIYGAWAYLDKGRAWGLKVNDRIFIKTDEKTVKGHVIGYFGPRKRLMSPAGYPIQEGAIVFIRTGQKKVRIGDSLIFDPTEYPAPWPPVPTPVQN